MSTTPGNDAPLSPYCHEGHIAVGSRPEMTGKKPPYRTLMWANAFLNLDSAFLFLLFESSL